MLRPPRTIRRGNNWLSGDHPDISEATAMDSLCEMFQVSPERYFRGFEEIPRDYVQTKADLFAPVSRKTVLNSFNPKLVKGRVHIMIVGAPSCGKSTLLERFMDNVNGDEEFTMIEVHPGYHPEDSVVSVPQFFLHRKYDKTDSQSTAALFSMLVIKSKSIVFLLDQLDSVPYEFERDCPEIGLFSRATPPVILHNLLTGKIFPDVKIVSTCRESRIKYLPPKLRPDQIVQLGELSSNSMETLGFCISGVEYGDLVKRWNRYPFSLYALNRNPVYLRYCVLTSITIESYRLTDTMPLTMLKVLLSCLYTRQYPRPSKDRRTQLLAYFCKLKTIANYILQEQKFRLTEEEVMRKFNVNVEEARSCASRYPMIIEYCPLIRDNNDGLMRFVGSDSLEFIGALYVAELPLSEYRNFLKLRVHKPEYRMVRRMLCALILDPDVRKPALKERLVTVPSDMDLRMELLQASMSEQFHKVKRRELLQFLHSVRDCGKSGSLDVLPDELGVVDLSHIQLFSMDMDAIATALSRCKTVEYLNLSNSGVTDYGMCVFAASLGTGTKIQKLNLDWCTEWKSSSEGQKALCKIIKKCNVDALSLNRNDLTVVCLHTMDKELGQTKIKTLHLNHNRRLKSDGFRTLTSFVKDHRVEDLYTSKEAATNLLSRLKD